MGVASDEAVPGDDIFVLDFLEGEMGFAQAVAFCVEVNETIRKKGGGGREAGFEEMGVEGLAFWEVSLLGVIEEFAEEGAGLRGQS